MNQNQLNNLLYGVQQGLLNGQLERTEELNTRILDRIKTETPLQPNFDPRPVPTKYSHFPIIDRVTPAQVPIEKYLDYYPELVFNPGNSKAPVSGFINNVSVESILRNQTTKLNHDQVGTNYVPSLKSDLYITQRVGGSQQMDPERELLFRNFQFDGFLHPNLMTNSNVGKELFSNHTRTQLRGSR